MDRKKIEGLKSSQEFPQGFQQQQQPVELQGKQLHNYTIWANLVNFSFTKTVFFYKVRVTCVDEEKAEFTISIEKDFNLRQRILAAFGIQGKLQEMFLGRQIQNDTLVKVIETQPDKRWELVQHHEGVPHNLELAIELQGEKTDQKSVLNQCRDILGVFQKNVIKQQRFGKNCQFDPKSRETVRGAEHIDLVTGLDLNMNVQKPAQLKLNVDFKVASIFNRDVTHQLKEQFQRFDTVSQDQLMKVLKTRKFTDGDNKLQLDDLSPKKEVYSPVEVMNLHATMQRSLRNLRFKRDPLELRLSSAFFMVENKDIHSSDAVIQAVKRKQLKDFQFQTFCNTSLQNLRNHWMFKENGILFSDSFNLVPIERSLSCEVQLGQGTIVSTHGQDGQQDRNQNNLYKNVSTKLFHLAKGRLERWTIVFESVSGMKQKIQAMVEKMQNQLGRLYGLQISTPNVVEVKDLSNFNWQVKDNEIVVVVLNSKLRAEQLTRKYEVVKYQCHKQGDVPNQVILSKTFEQGDFIKMVVLNIMQDVIMKLPNNIGHKINFDAPMSKWLGGKTMVFAMDVYHRKGHKSVAAVLSYTTGDFTHFRTDQLVKDEEQSELKYSDETKLKFKELVKKAVLDWEQHNQSSVHRVVFLRDGITDFQRRFVENTEIAYVNEVFAELGREQVQLWFLTANKRISTKIFEWNARENKLNHLEAGIYINRDLVKDGLPSFQLNASNNRLSKCCFQECLQPKQVENAVDFDSLMSLVFKLSFLQFHGQNIANISVPALLKQAEKKAQFQSIIHSLKSDEDEGKDMQDIHSVSSSSLLKRKRD